MPKKEKIARMFDTIAGDYDLLNHILSLDIDRRWRREALRQIIDPDRSQEILDVACGTGDFTLAIARTACPRSHVTGIDISEGMLSRAREKAGKTGFGDRITLEAGDGEALRFGDGTFDVVTVAFGVRNFEDRKRGLREMRRVLKPEGKLVVLELSRPANPVLRWCYGLYLRHCMPWIGGLMSGDKSAYRYLTASVERFPMPREFKATLKACGFRQIRQKPLSFGICRLYTAVK